MCTMTELQDQITALSKQNADEHKAITKVLEAWTPLMECYQKEVTRAKAYSLVAADLKTKGNNWKFWLGLAALVFTVLGGVFWLAEIIKIRR